VKERLVGYTFVMDSTRDVCEHFTARLSRLEMTNVVYRAASSPGNGKGLVVVDIGGDMTRAAHMKKLYPNVSCIYVLRPGDQSSADAKDKFRGERETPGVILVKEDLNTWLEHAPKYDVVVSVLSLWYLDPSDLCAAIKRSTCGRSFHAIHPFHERYGEVELWGHGATAELHAVYTADGHWVDSNIGGTKYSHDVCRWLNDGCVQVPGTESWLASTTLSVNTILFSQVIGISVANRALCVGTGLTDPVIALPLRHYEMSTLADMLLSMIGPGPIVNRLVHGMIDESQVTTSTVLVDRDLTHDAEVYAQSMALTPVNLRLIAHRYALSYRSKFNNPPSVDEVTAVSQHLLDRARRIDYWVPQMLMTDTRVLEDISVQPTPYVSTGGYLTSFVGVAVFVVVCALMLLVYLLGKGSELATLPGSKYLRKYLKPFKELAKDSEAAVETDQYPSDMPDQFDAPVIVKQVTFAGKDKEIDECKMEGLHVRPPKVKDDQRLMDTLDVPCELSEKALEKPTVVLDAPGSMVLLGPYTANKIPCMLKRSQQAMVESITKRLGITLPVSEKAMRVSYKVLLAHVHAQESSKFLMCCYQQIMPDFEGWKSRLQPTSVTSLKKFEDCPYVNALFERLGGLKCEKVYGFTRKDDGTLVAEPTVARLISALRHYYGHTKVGPWTVPLVDTLYELTMAVARRELPVSMVPWLSVLHCSPSELGVLMFMLYDLGYRFFRSQDFSGYDGTFGRYAAAYEIARMREMGLSNEDSTVLENQVACNVATRCKVRFEKTEGRNSGDSNTSSGNTMDCGDMCSFVYRLEKDVVVLCAGDDTLICSKQEFHTSIHDATMAFAKFGKVLKARDSGLSGATFLSGRFVPCVRNDHPSMQFTPLPCKCLPKLFWSTSPAARSKPRDILSAIVFGALPVFKADHYITKFLQDVIKCGKLTAPEVLTLEGLPWFFRMPGKDVSLVEDVSVDLTGCLESYHERYGSLVAESVISALDHYDPALGVVIQELPFPREALEFDDL